LREWGLASSTISPRERTRTLPKVGNVEGRCEIAISVDVVRPRRMFPRTTLSEEGSRQEVASSNIKIRGRCRMIKWFAPTSPSARASRSRVIVDASRVASLRARGNSWSQIQAELGVSKGTAQRALAGLPKIV
jgi:hypothetical protein